MTSRHPEDFLGWAPAVPLEWAPELPSDAPSQPTGRAPDATRVPAAARAEVARTPRLHQPTTAPARAVRRPSPAGRQQQPAGPLFGVTAIAAGILLLFTIAMVIRELAGEGELGLIPIFAGGATLALMRAAAAMRSR